MKNILLPINIVRKKAFLSVVAVIVASAYYFYYDNVQYQLYRHGLTIESALYGYAIKMPRDYYPSYSSEAGLGSIFGGSKEPTIIINKLSADKRDKYILLSIMDIPRDGLNGQPKRYSWGDAYIVDVKDDMCVFVLDVKGFLFFGNTTDVSIIDEIISIERIAIQ